MDIVKTLQSAGIIPVIVIEREDQAVPLARALVAGGLPVLEVTFRTDAAAGAIAAIRGCRPSRGT
jgi:2-dehydro-3-deoxyphosphogluconate aldolase/(4S)-4-hydroxy-2-oxoglutarate aldolase